jgi:hypothetical protein
MALKSDGTVWGWGENHTHGKLGNGTNKDPPRGVLIPATNMTLDGRVWAWGGNFAGQLGTTENEFISDRYVPVTIIGLTGVVAIAAGDLHNLALREDGTVYAWGSNFTGQLGNGTYSSYYSFVQLVDNLTDVVAIAAGSAHSMVLKSDGTVWAWGSNTSGQLGNGTDQDSNIPVQAIGLTSARAIAAGGRQSLAVVQPLTTSAPVIIPTTVTPTTPSTTATASTTITAPPTTTTTQPTTTAAPPASSQAQFSENGGGAKPGILIFVWILVATAALAGLAFTAIIMNKRKVAPVEQTTTQPKSGAVSALPPAGQASQSDDQQPKTRGTTF